MGDWNEYLDQIEELPKEIPEAEGNKPVLLGRDEIAEFLRHLSGKDVDGRPKAYVSYQTYAMEDDGPEKERIYRADKAWIELSFDEKNPEFYTLDVVFNGYDDPELKLMWGRLQAFKRNMAQNGEKDWIFYINILERASVSVQTQNRDRLLIGHVLNPLVFYLTREVPNQLIDERDVGGELQGGNIIRMLIPERLVTFQVTEDIDTPLVKGEVLREFETERYLDASEGQKEENW